MKKYDYLGLGLTWWPRFEVVELKEETRKCDKKRLKETRTRLVFFRCYKEWK